MTAQDKFAQLQAETDQKLNVLDQGPLDVVAQMDAMQKKLEEAAQITDKEERDIRIKILDAEMAQLRQDVKKEEQDLAEAILGLNIMVEGMGASYNDLARFNKSEQAIIDVAQNAVTLLDGKLISLKTAWIFKASRTQTAKDDLEIANQALVDSKNQAAKLMRNRLLNQDMDASLQEFQVKVDATIEIMKRRLEDIKTQVDVVGTRKDAAFEAKEQAARDLETATSDLETKESELETEDEILIEIPNGSAEYVEQEQVISAIKKDLEDIRGQRNIKLALFESKEKFATELEVHLAAQQKLRSNQEMWITVLESDTEERVVTFKSRLEAMQASSDQEIAQQLDNLGAKVDQNNAEYMASVTVASDKMVTEKFAAHPERQEEMSIVHAAQLEAIAMVEKKHKAFVQAMADKYGIDPTLNIMSSYNDVIDGTVELKS